VIYGDTHFYQHRHLPHLVKAGKTFFVTFCTRNRLCLTAEARDFVLASCIHDHERLCWIHCVAVMPDHVHLITTPFERTTLDAVIRRIKSASAFRVNRLLGRTGALWQRDSFDHQIRSDESLSAKCEYIANNPVRAGLVSDWREYKWFWSVGAGS
jgi:REP element-mobilizing transposase RayT